MTGDWLVKALLSACFIATCVAVMLAYGTPAQGYESSIYASTPWPVWAILVACIACGIGVVVFRTAGDKYDGLMAAGYLLILWCNVIILSMHILRGYYLWNILGDSGTHMGWVRDIISTGFLNEKNFYPVCHLILSMTSLASDIDPITLYKWLPVMFGILYIVFMLFFSRSVFRDRGHAMIAAVLGTALLTGWNLGFTPSHFSNLAFPLALFVIFRSRSDRHEWSLIFLIICALYMVFHPLASISLIIIVGSVLLYMTITRALKGGHVRNAMSINYTSLAIMVTMTIAWITSFTIWDSSIGYTYNVISTGAPSGISAAIGEASYAAGHGYNVIEYFIKVYGALLVVIALAMAAFLISVIKKERSDRLTVLFPPIIVMLLVVVCLYIITTYFSPGRFFVYILILCTLPAGFILYEAVSKFREKNKALMAFACLAVTGIILLLSVQGIFNLYPSTNTLSVSLQTTESELNGVKWLFKNGAEDTQYYTSWYFQPSMYADFLMTDLEKAGRIDLTPYRTSPFPDHLGQSSGIPLGSYYGQNSYLVIRDALKHVYTDVYPEMAKYRLLPEDFESLENDGSVDKLYDNGGIDLWRVHGLSS